MELSRLVGIIFFAWMEKRYSCCWLLSNVETSIPSMYATRQK
jgi:hypothetical protein